MLYFSYGSNMSCKRLRDRVPSVKYCDTATLVGHTLRFHKKSIDGSGKCDAFMTNCPADEIIGVVFEIDEAEKPILDEREGLGKGYDEKEVLLASSSSGEIKALTYVASSIDETLKPYQWYKYHVLVGAKENGLPEEYIMKISEIEAIEDPKQERHEREMEIYAMSSSPEKCERSEYFSGELSAMLLDSQEM